MIKKTALSSSSGIPSRGQLWWATFAIFFIALFLRLLPWEHVFSNGRIYYYDPDCYMRLRKILVYLASFPSTSIHDYFQGYPRGTGVITPPTMEYLIAALAWPFRSAPSLIPVLERIIAVIPPVMGALTAAILCRFTAGIAGVYAGLTAGLVLAVTPAHMDATILGRFDNEMMEPLLLLLAFLGYLKTYYDGDRLRPWIVAGCLACLYLSIWRGGVAFLSLVGLDLLARLWKGREDRQQLRHLGRGATCMYIVTASLLALICLTDLWGSRLLFCFNIISWFHVLLFAGSAALFYGISCGLKKSLRFGLIYCVAVLVPLLLVLGAEFVSGLSLLGGGNPWLDSILQYQRQTDPAAFVSNFGLVLLLLPLGICLLTLEPFRRLPERRFLIIWSIVMLVAALSRQRYSEYLALNSALAAGICVSWVMPRIPLSRVKSAVIVIILLLLFQLPTLPAISFIKEQKVTEVFRGDLEETLDWLREKTPPAGDPYHPDQKPAYGVLARWDYGGWIETVAQRPSIATNYGTETCGMEEAARFFLSTEESQMSAVLKRNGIRYLIVDNLMTDISMYAGLIGSKAELFTLHHDPRSGKISYLPNPQLYQLIVSRLFYADGSAASVQRFQFSPVEGVRLMFESSSPALVFGLPWQVARIKVFEYAPGAVLMVETAPGRMVSIIQPVETNQGRRFVYRNSKTADRSGLVSFRIVYLPKTGDTSGASGPVEIEAGGVRKVVPFTASDIETQKQVKVRI